MLFKLRNKTLSKIHTNRLPFAAVLVPMLVSSAFLAISTANARTPPIDVPTYAYMQAYPNPIGVNQPMYLFGWLDKVPPTASGIYGDRWENLSIEITKPDGSTEKLTSITSDPVGTVFQIYTPNQVGTYTFQMSFPGQTLAGSNPAPSQTDISRTSVFIGDYFMPSISNKISVTVQNEPIQSTYTPVPTDYWTRPINNINKGWGNIAGNWLGTGSIINLYSTAPETAHIMWTKPITFGGTVGGNFADNAYYTGNSYESYWSPPIIMNGVLYYNKATPPIYGFTAVDLRTGKELWYQNGSGPMQVSGGFLKQNYPQLSFGQLLNYNSPNQHGVIPYLWSTYTDAGQSVWALYDAFTGNWICDISGVPTASVMFGASSRMDAPDGSIIIYTPNLRGGYMTVWNSTACIQNSYPSNSPLANNGYWLWRPTLAGTINASLGYTANVTLSSQIPTTASNAGIDSDNQIMILSTDMARLGSGTFPSPTSYTQAGISLKPGEEGKLLWIKTNPWPSGNVTLSVGAIGDGAYAIFAKETRQWYVYSTLTGDLMWGPSQPETELHMYGVTAAIAYGKLFSADSIGAGGMIYAYDLKSGELLWNHATPSMGFDGYWPTSPASIGCIADNKLYLYGFEHSPGPDLERGFEVRCLDADTGDELWVLPFWANGLAVADGYLVGLNSYDNQIYAIGKGPSATTITTPQTAIPKGTSVLLTGTVTDQSAGAKQLVQDGKFSVVPAVSDQSMTPWMEYLYMQMPKPESATGVTVKLTGYDPAGNPIDIGTTTTDINGKYGLTWTPTLEGTYHITATFDGTNSYGGSQDSAYLAVGPAVAAQPTSSPAPTSTATSPSQTSQPTQTIAPTTTASPTPAPDPTTGTTDSTLYVAIAATVIIVAVIAAAIALRRRK